MNNRLRQGKKIWIVAAALLLTACDMATPSQLSLDKIQLKETMQTAVINAEHVDEGRLDAVVRHYQRHGTGPLSLTLAYPAGNEGTERNVRLQGTEIGKRLRESGIDDLNVDFVQIAPEAYSAQAVLTFAAMSALPPESCGERLPGMNGTATLAELDSYMIGCETNTNISKMLAYPEDLKGRAGLPPTTSRRHGAVVEGYSSGTPNEALEGYSASGYGN